MIPKSGYRFSEKIMLKQKSESETPHHLDPFRFSAVIRRRVMARATTEIGLGVFMHTVRNQ